MSYVEIISIQLLIECLGKTQNSDYLYLKTNIDDRKRYTNYQKWWILMFYLGDKSYVCSINGDLKIEKSIHLYALKRGNSKNPLPKPFRNMISKLRRSKSTFNQVIEHFNIERVKSNSMLELSTMLEIKSLYFNLLAYIGKPTTISNILNFN